MKHSHYCIFKLSTNLSLGNLRRHGERETDRQSVCVHACVCVHTRTHMHAYFTREGQVTREEHQDRDSVRRQAGCAAGQRGGGVQGAGRGGSELGRWTGDEPSLSIFFMDTCLDTVLPFGIFPPDWWQSQYYFSATLLKMDRQHHLHFCLYSRVKEQKQAGKMTVQWVQGCQ